MFLLKMTKRCAHGVRIFWSYLGGTKIKTGIIKSILVRGPEGKLDVLGVLFEGFKYVAELKKNILSGQ